MARDENAVLPAAASWGFGLLGATAGTGAERLSGASIQLIGALLLIVLARPLARVLSHNRLLRPLRAGAVREP